MPILNCQLKVISKEGAVAASHSGGLSRSALAKLELNF